MIVADTNIIASLWVPNDKEELTYKALEKDVDWIAPVLWKSEFRNVLAKYLRAGLLDFPTLVQVMEEAEQFMSHKEFDVDSTQVLSLVFESSCSAYDCEFVALAKDFDSKLLTFDKGLAREFPGIVIHPKQFTSQG